MEPLWSRSYKGSGSPLLRSGAGSPNSAPCCVCVGSGSRLLPRGVAGGWAGRASIMDKNSPQHRAITVAEAQGWVNNRSVMPLDAVWLHARYNGGSQTCAAERRRYCMCETPPRPGLNRVKPATNKEFLVPVGHHPTGISLLLFVHTARRSYRLG